MTGCNNGDNRYHQQQTVQCPNCKASVTVEELYEYVNTHPESKREVIHHEIEMWGLTSNYDRQYLVDNIVFCPRCARISHLSDWLEVSSSSCGGIKK